MGNIKETDIINILKTKENANEFVSFLDVLLDNTHSVSDFNAKNILQSEFKDKELPEWSDFLISKVNLCMSGSGADKNGIQEIRKLIADLETRVGGARVVKLEIPFNPSGSFAKEVYDLLNNSDFFLSIDTKLKDNFLIDISVNRSIKGGIKLFIEGKFIDVTYRSFVLNYLMSKDVIKRYL